MTKQAINHIHENLTNVIFLMNTVAMIGVNNTLQTVQGGEVSGLLSHFTEQLQGVVNLIAELTPTEH